jgi:hypothetical protein
VARDSISKFEISDFKNVHAGNGPDFCGANCQERPLKLDANDDLIDVPRRNKIL